MIRSFLRCLLSDSQAKKIITPTNIDRTRNEEEMMLNDLSCMFCDNFNNTHSIAKEQHKLKLKNNELILSDKVHYF
jgi:hypothetical protein